VGQHRAGRGTASARDGVGIAYRVAGAGAPVVLLHGAGLSQVVWRGLGYVDALAGFTTITVDLRGHGLSDGPDDPRAYAIDRLAGDVVAVLDDLDLPAAHVVGYSLGARVGFQLVRRSRARVRSLVSLAGTYRAMAGLPARLFFPDYTQAIRDGGMAGFVDRWRRSGKRALDDATARALRRNDPRAMLALFAALEDEDGIPEAELEAARCPTLLVAGDRDRIAWDASVAAHHLLPGSTFLDLPGADHIDTLARRDRILHAAIPFLDSQDR
jgi:pimeloyl-ACP methyl ester carboxylesterase